MPITWRRKAAIACQGCHQTHLRCEWVEDGLGRPLPCVRCTENGFNCKYPLKSTTTSPYRAPIRAPRNRLAVNQSTQAVTNNSDCISTGRLAALPQPQQSTAEADAGHVETQTNGVTIAGPNYHTDAGIDAATLHDTLYFSHEGAAIHRDTVFQYPAFSNEDLFNMPLPDDLGQILIGVIAIEAGSQFTAHGCMYSETYPNCCVMHDLGCTHPTTAENDGPFNQNTTSPSQY